MGASPIWGGTLTLWRLSEGESLSVEDHAAYGDSALPPSSAPGPGQALHRQGLQSVGLDGASWTSGEPTPGVAPL